MTNRECSTFNESTLSNYQCRWVGYKFLSQSKTRQVEAQSLVVLYVALKVAWNIFLKYVKQYRWIMWNVLSSPSCLHCQWSWRSCHLEGRRKLGRHAPVVLCIVLWYNYTTSGFDKTCSRMPQMFSEHLSVFRESSLGAFAKLRKTAISFVVYALPSVRPRGIVRPTPDELSRNFIFEYFHKICPKIQISLKSDKNNGYFTWRPMYIYGSISMYSS